MAAKTKCPTCGAKNDVANHRCRLCTAVINPNAAPPPPVEEPVSPLGADHFDAGEINRQIRPARERFGSDSGALAARLAAARGSSAEPISDEAGNDAREVAGDDLGTDIAFATERPFSEPIPRASAAPTAAPIEFDDEPFDPDALFRDMS